MPLPYQPAQFVHRAHVQITPSLINSARGVMGTLRPSGVAPPIIRNSRAQNWIESAGVHRSFQRH